MSPEHTSVAPAPRPRTRRWLFAAGVLHCAGMLLVMSALVRLTPLTLTFSLGGGGLLLATALGIYIVTVAYDLRRRRIL